MPTIAVITAMAREFAGHPARRVPRLGRRPRRGPGDDARSAAAGITTWWDGFDIDDAGTLDPIVVAEHVLAEDVVKLLPRHPR